MNFCPTVGAYSFGVPTYVRPREINKVTPSRKRALMRTGAALGDWITLNRIIIAVLLIVLAAPVWAGYDGGKLGRGASAHSGQRIATIQRGLAALSYRPGPADGIMGRKTRKAIRAFQAKKGLSITGEVSKELEVAIRSAKRTQSSSLADLKVCQEAVDAKIWAVAMRTCRSLAEGGSAEQPQLSQGMNWLQAKLCRTLNITC